LADEDDAGDVEDGGGECTWHGEMVLVVLIGLVSFKRKAKGFGEEQECMYANVL